MPEPVVAIVVAAGSGQRLGGATPKALRTLGNQTLVERSARALFAGGCDHVVVVIPAGLDDEFGAALASLTAPVTLVAGGSRRQDSVLCGLAAIQANPDLDDNSVVLVHDAARPLVPVPVVRDVIAAAQAGAAAVVPALAVVDSIRQLTGDTSEVIDRASLRAIQTPQGFQRRLLWDAHHEVARRALDVTDDAAVLEACGYPVVLVAGAREALKITEPFDLIVAEALLAEQDAARIEPS